NRQNRCGLLLLQLGSLILMNVYNPPRSSIGAHASPRKPNLAADPEGAALRQIDELFIALDLGRAGSDVGCRGFFWPQPFFSTAAPNKIAPRGDPGNPKFCKPKSGTPGPPPTDDPP